MNNIVRDAYNNCKIDEWLKYGDDRYVPFSDLGLRGSDGDIIGEMRRAILASDEATQLLMSGFRGSGKTTELKRLAHMLEQDGFSVVFIDTEAYLNLRMPATVSDLWISIAAGFDQFLEDTVGAAHELGRFWDRVTAFMNREVKVSDLKIKVPQAGEFQVALKDNPAFRNQLNDVLEARRPMLVRECWNFVEEGVALLAKSRKGASGTVIIIDSFEKLQGDARTLEDVRVSVETLFTRDWKLLQTPCHTVYTVPPWLAFTETAADNDLGRTRLLPMCKVREKSGDTCEDGIQALTDMLNKRMDAKAIFGDTQLLRPLIKLSGGYPRDLLRMVRDLLLRNMEADALPVSSEKLDADIERIIQIYTELFETGLNGEDIPLLVDIAGDNDTAGWSREKKFRLAELFEHHFVLSYQNGERWLDLHPLLRETPSLKTALLKESEKEA